MEKRHTLTDNTALRRYEFDLGGKTVSGLRIDPDSVGGVATLFTGVELNPPQFWLLLFVPNGGQRLLLLGLPASAAPSWALVRGRRPAYT